MWWAHPGGFELDRRRAHYLSDRTELRCEKGGSIRHQPNPYSVIFKRLLVRITDIQKNHLKYQKVPFIPGIVSVKNSKHF